MTSKAEASFVCKSFGSNLLPNDSPEVGISAVFKKKQRDATLGLQLNDATLRDPKSAKGVVLSLEKPLGAGVKGSLAYNVGTQDAIGSVTVDKKINSYDLSLKATYQLKGDVFTLQETWKVDSQNKLVGTYNFAKEEAVFNYEHTWGALKLGALYNLKTEKPVLSVQRKSGKHTLAASYGPRDEATTFTWTHKPCKVVVSGKTGKGGVKGVQAKLMLTHEFDL